MPASPDLDLITAIVLLLERYGQAPSYARMWAAAASSRVPARRQGRGWRIREADLPVVAAYFGLVGAHLASGSMPSSTNGAASEGANGVARSGGSPAAPEGHPVLGRRGTRRARRGAAHR